MNDKPSHTPMTHLDTLRHSLAALDKTRDDVPPLDDDFAWKHYKWCCGLAMGAVVGAARLVAAATGEKSTTNGAGGSNE
jgi:hypothetical protein